MVGQMYIIMIKVDKTLPWIELDETYQTKREAREAANQALKSMKTKVVNVPEKKKAMKTVASIRVSR
jgi:hypothetical protein